MEKEKTLNQELHDDLFVLLERYAERGIYSSGAAEVLIINACDLVIHNSPNHLIGMSFLLDKISQRLEINCRELYNDKPLSKEKP